MEPRIESAPSLKAKPAFETYQELTPSRAANYRRVFEHIASERTFDTREINRLRTPAEVVIDPSSGLVAQTVEGEVDGFKYKIGPPQKTTGHVTVGYVDITDPTGEQFECVIRSNLTQARDFLERVRKTPNIADFVPHLYGIGGAWAVIEKVNGLESYALADRIDADKELRNAYAGHVFRLIDEVANNGLRLNDVLFEGGHNVMMDPETGQVKLVEHQNIQKEEYLEPNEVITEKLFEIIFESTREFSFEVLRQALTKYKPEQLFKKFKKLLPSHPQYLFNRVVAYWDKNGFEDQDLKKLLAEPERWKAEAVPLEDYMERGEGFTKVLAPEVIQAVLKNDFDAYKDFIDQSRKAQRSDYISEIKDENDPRFGVVYLSNYKSLDNITPS